MPNSNAAPKAIVYSSNQPLLPRGLATQVEQHNECQRCEDRAVREVAEVVGPEGVGRNPAEQHQCEQRARDQQQGGHARSVHETLASSLCEAQRKSGMRQVLAFRDGV